MQDLQVRRCDHCGHIISEREIALYRGLVRALWKVFVFCKDKNIHEFTRKDIKHLFSNENDTARFGDWVMFGGLVYKNKKASYGLNLERCHDFFRGEYSIPIRVWKNPVTKVITKGEYKTIHEIPKLKDMLNSDMEYVARYRN